MADEREFGLERFYLKDLSFESPRAPEVFTEEWKPDVQMDINSKARAVGPDRYEVVLTSRADHALDSLVSTPESELEARFDAVASVGGDGIFNEVVSGLIRRAAAASGTDVSDPDSQLAAPSLPVARIWPPSSAHKLVV